MSAGMAFAYHTGCDGCKAAKVNDDGTADAVGLFAVSAMPVCYAPEEGSHCSPEPWRC
jgi:hypothetical protein